MTRIGRPAPVLYRGLSIAPHVATPSTPLQMPHGPLTHTPSSSNAPRGVPAHELLACVINVANSTRGPSSPERYNPAVDFAGIGRICGTLEIPDQGKYTMRQSGCVTLGKGGKLLFPVAAKADEFDVPHMVTATLGDTGQFRDCVVRSAPFLNDPTLLLCDDAVIGHSTSGGYLLGGRLGVTNSFSGLPFHGVPTLISDRRVVVAYQMALHIKELAADGSWSTLDSVKLTWPVAINEGVAVRGNVAVAVNKGELASFIIRGSKLTAVNQVSFNEESGTVTAPVLTHNVVLATVNDKLIGRTIAGDGTLGTGQTLSFGKPITAVAVRGNIAVVGVADGTIQAVHFNSDGTFDEPKQALTGMIAARPVITRDGVVLVGTNEGAVVALRLASDGTLTETARTKAGGPIRQPLTITADGFVLASTPGKLVALRG
jgi:hypothetical protein